MLGLPSSNPRSNASSKAARASPAAALASREFILGAVLLLALDAFFLRWVWLHFDHWGFWDWDYQQTLLEVARISILEHHQLPLWNPYIGGGVSLAGNTLNHVWSPSFALILLFGTTAGVKLCIPVYLAIAQFGMWRLARARTQGPLAALLAAVVFTLGGVYAQRLTHGHFEWIAIAWMPHVLVYLHRALARVDERSVWLGGIAFAFVFLDGGPYQFAFFALFAGAYAATLGIEHKSLRPLEDLAVIGGIGVCLAAIKLFPVYEVASRFPRLTLSDISFYGAPFTPTAGEILHQMFVSRAQEHDPELWMPYILNVGCYVGWIPLLLVGYAVVRNFRRNAVWVALSLVLLSLALGAASPLNLWRLLHELPFLSSLRVPARFNVYLLILLSLLAGEGLQRIVETLQQKSHGTLPGWLKRWPEALAAALVIGVAVDLAWVNGRVFRVAFSIPAQEIQRQEHFAHYFDSPYLERQKQTALFKTHPNWNATFPAVLENRGVLQSFRTILSGRSAIPMGAKEYKGEVWMHDEAHEAIVSQRITPSELSVQTDGRPGVVVFNVNHDPGWKSITPGAADPIKIRGRLALRLAAGETEVTLQYRPTAFTLGALLTAATLAVGLVRALRRRGSSPA